MKKFIVTKQYKSGSTLPTVVAWFDDAKDAHEAKATVNHMYRTGDVILTADDFDSYNLECLGMCKNKKIEAL